MRSLVFLMLLFTACSQSDTWQRIQQTSTLRIGLDPSFPPFENADSGELVGIDVDLASAIANELALTPQFDYIGYDGLYDALLTERVDVLISALVVDEGRSADFAFSDPYFNAGQVLLVSADSPIQQLSDLANHTVAVELGAMGHVAAIEQQKDIENLQVMTFTTPDDVIAAMGEGTADAAIIDNITAQFATALVIIDPPITVEPFALVVRANDRALLNQLNTTLKNLQSNGKLETILKTHFNQQ